MEARKWAEELTSEKRDLLLKLLDLEGNEQLRMRASLKTRFAQDPDPSTTAGQQGGQVHSDRLWTGDSWTETAASTTEMAAPTPSTGPANKVHGDGLWAGVSWTDPPTTAAGVSLPPSSASNQDDLKSVGEAGKEDYHGPWTGTYKEVFYGIDEYGKQIWTAAVKCRGCGKRAVAQKGKGSSPTKWLTTRGWRRANNGANKWARATCPSCMDRPGW